MCGCRTRGQAGYSWPAFPIHGGGRKTALLLPVEPRTVLEPQTYERVGKSLSLFPQVFWPGVTAEGPTPRTIFSITWYCQNTPRSPHRSKRNAAAVDDSPGRPCLVYRLAQVMSLVHARNGSRDMLLPSEDNSRCLRGLGDHLGPCTPFLQFLIYTIYLTDQFSHYQKLFSRNTQFVSIHPSIYPVFIEHLLICLL